MMNKEQIIQIVEQEGNVAKSVARKIVNAVLEAIELEYADINRIKEIRTISTIRAVEFAGFKLIKEKALPSLKLEIRNGNIVYVKRDGTTANKDVPGKVKLEFMKFKLPPEAVKNGCDRAMILAGDPVRDTVLLVSLDGLHLMGEFLVSNEGHEAVSLGRRDDSNVKQFLFSRSGTNPSFEEILEQLPEEPPSWEEILSRRPMIPSKN